MASETPPFSALFLSSARPRLWGGGEKWLVQVAAHLRTRGHSVIIAGRPASRLLEAAADAGVPVEEVSFSGDLDLRTVARVRHLITSHQVDIVLNTFDKEVRISGLAALSLGRRGHGTRILCRKGLPLLDDNWRYRLTYAHFVDGIITPAVSIRERLMAHGWLQVPIHVLPNGVDLERFLFQPDRQPVPDPSWPAGPSARVVHLARFSRQKGHSVLLAAAAALRDRFPDTQYVLVGDGAEREAIAAERTRLDLERHVHMAGHRWDSAAVLAAGDIVVLPSVDEGYPNVLIEAMAVGRPVVASAVGDSPMIVREGVSGFLVPPGAPGPFAERLAQLLADATLRQQMGERARALAEKEHGLEPMIAGAERLLGAEASLARVASSTSARLR